MRRLITFTVIFAAICCISCKKEKTPEAPPPPVDTTINVKPTIKTYDVGSFYEKDGVIGIVYKVDTTGLKGMIVSLDEITNCIWSNTTGSTKAGDYDDGKKNLAAIIEYGDIANFPGFNWCEKKNKDGISGWYLPAIEELWELGTVYNQLKDSLKSLKDRGITGATEFVDGEQYWSSTEVNDQVSGYPNAYYVRLSNPVKNSSFSKQTALRARAIRAF